MAGARVITGTHFSRHYRHRDDTVILFTVPIGRLGQRSQKQRHEDVRKERKRELTRKSLEFPRAPTPPPTNRKDVVVFKD